MSLTKIFVIVFVNGKNTCGNVDHSFRCFNK